MAEDTANIIPAQVRLDSERHRRLKEKLAKHGTSWQHVLSRALDEWEASVDGAKKPSAEAAGPDQLINEMVASLKDVSRKLSKILGAPPPATRKKGPEADKKGAVFISHGHELSKEKQKAIAIVAEMLSTDAKGVNIIRSAVNDYEHWKKQDQAKQVKSGKKPSEAKEERKAG